MGNGFETDRDEEEVLRGTMESSIVDGTSGVCHTVCRVSVKVCVSVNTFHFERLIPIQQLKSRNLKDILYARDYHMSLASSSSIQEILAFPDSLIPRVFFLSVRSTEM